MKSNRFIKRTLATAFTLLIAQPSISAAANPAMQEPSYFDPDLLAERSKPTQPISDYRYQLNLRSLRQGLPSQAVPLLWQEKGLDAESVMQHLLAKLVDLGIDTKTVERQEQDDRRFAVYGKGWKLKVYGDGSRASFRNYAYLDEKEEAMAKLPPLKPEQLVDQGQRFVAKVLGDQIRLSEAETLVPFGVQYQINAQQSVDGKTAEQTTVAAAVVFSRTFKGVDVLGKGSKVAVLFANDGTPFGFDFDWPALYDAGVDQTVAPVDELQRRAIKVARLEGNEVKVQLDRFECGYYDAGQRKRGKAPMQPACFHFYSAQSEAKAEDGASGMLSMAFVDAVPAGTEIIADENWDNALKLLYGPDAVPEGEAGGKALLREKSAALMPSARSGRF